MTISEKIKFDLASEMNLERLFQKHVIDGSSYIFREHLQRPDDEYQLRHEVAVACECNLHDVIIIGSAKLGFSVKNDDFRGFDSRYTETKKTRDKSDIDIAVVNRRFYDDLTQQIYLASNHFDDNWIEENWKHNHYNTDPEAKLFSNYTKYLAKGWVRPDFMPNACIDGAEWKIICNKWKKKLDRKVSIGIYSNWFYLKNYHIDHLTTLRAKIQTLHRK